MKKKTVYLTLFLILFLIFGNLVFAQNILNPTDHTKVMLFTLKHQSEIAKWIKSRNRKTKPSSQEVLNFLYTISDNRSTYDIHLILQRTLNTTTKIRIQRRFRSLNPDANNLINEIKNTSNIFQLKQLLKRKVRMRSGNNGSMDIGIQIANRILQDGINKNLYSENTLKRFSPKRKGMTRGFWQNAYDFINDLAKDDVAGAIVGAIVAGVSTAGVALPEGAVAGAIEASAGSVAENILSNILSNPTPAY